MRCSVTQPSCAIFLFVFLPHFLSHSTAQRFTSSRIFQNPPDFGITLAESSPSTRDGYLINGATDDMAFDFIFYPENASPDQYALSFTCDSTAVHTNTACTLSNTFATIVASDTTAYNTSVTCNFDNFPGSTSCTLTATLQTTVRAVLNSTTERLPLLRQAVQYVSPAVINNVYGVVFYRPDASGVLSAASVVSGDENKYQVSNYYTSDPGIEQISIFGYLPGGSDITGSSGLSLFSSATVTSKVEDVIFWYDTSSCQLTDATITSGTFSLPNVGNCAIGMAVSDESSYPTLGVNFRPYKSGKISLLITWPSLGTSTEAYEQVVHFEIVEPAPPVITSISKAPIYRSTPCFNEYLLVKGYNFRYANSRYLVVDNDDSSTKTWKERSRDGFLYDADTDTAQVYFLSAGGLGTDVFFTMYTTFGSAVREAIVISVSGTTVSLIISFTQPPVLSSISPSSSSVGGSDSIILSGSIGTFGDAATDSLYVGGYVVSSSDVVIDGNAITFSSPPLSDLGLAYTYDVYIAICAERSNSLALTYLVAPELRVSSSDSSVDDNGRYIIPSDGRSTFIAEVSGNNDGVVYSWRLLDIANDDVPTPGSSTDTQTFIVQASFLSTYTQEYSLVGTVTNSIGRSSSVTVNILLAAPSVQYLIVNVYEIETLYRSSDAVAAVQSNIALPARVETIPDIVLEWSYRDTTYRVDDTIVQIDNTTVDETVTGPTRFGREFFIARQDLVVGSTKLFLKAFYTSDSSISGSDNITIEVLQSELSPVINEGFNGTVFLNDEDLLLYGSNSGDPDILANEGDPAGGLSHEWTSCRKFLSLAPEDNYTDCSDILPADVTQVNITLTSGDLLTARLDKSSEPASTFFSFGLRVSKGSRSAEVFQYFEMKTIPEPQRIPTLDALEVVDSKGIVMDRERVSLLADAIIQPVSADPLVEWTFDMKKQNQQYLFSQVGVLKNDSGFIAAPRIKSRFLLGFRANQLDPATEYQVKVSVSASDTSLVSTYDISFVTGEVPELTCTPPLNRTGLVSSATFTISGQLSYQTPDIEYCFSLVSTNLERFVVGHCSVVPFTSFTFPQEGNYSMECIAKTVSGYVVDNVTLPETLTLFTPEPSPEATVIDILTERVANLSAELEYCEAIRDDGCLTRLISVAKDIAAAVEREVANDLSTEAQSLLEATKAYVAKLIELSESLAENLIFTPNQVEPAIDLSLYLTLIPSSMIQDEAALYSALKQMEIAIKSTESNTSLPVVSNDLVEKVSTASNLSITAAYNLDQGGTSRMRLAQGETVVRSTFSNVFQGTMDLLAQARAQQEDCGYDGVETTELNPEYQKLVATTRDISTGDVNVLPIAVHVKVSCSEEQMSQPIKVGLVENEVCRSIVSNLGTQRTILRLTMIPESIIQLTGLLKEFDSAVEYCPSLQISGIDPDVVPLECFKITLPLKPNVLQRLQEQSITAGILEKPTVSYPEVCTPDTCLNFVRNENDVVNVRSGSVTIRTQNQGIFIAGQDLRAPPPPPTVDGSFLGLGSKIAIGACVGLAFIAGLALVSFFATREEGLPSPQDQVLTSWEYVERDLFGRAEEDDIDFDDPATIVPRGAEPPSVGPMAMELQRQGQSHT